MPTPQDSQSKMVEDLFEQQMISGAMTSKKLVTEFACRVNNKPFEKFQNKINKWITALNLIPIAILGLFLGKNFKKKMLAKLVKAHFENHFKLRGITHYLTKPFPKKPSKPMLILTTKLHETSSLFAYTLFNFPIIIPLNDKVYPFPLVEWLPLLNLNKGLKCISYPNVSLNTSWPALRELLADGHSLLIEINPDIHEPMLRGSVPVYAAVKDILQDKDLPADLYFLHLDGYDLFPIASNAGVISVRADLKTPDQLYTYWETASVEEKLYRLHSHFQIWEPQLIIPKPKS